MSPERLPTPDNTERPARLEVSVKRLAEIMQGEEFGRALTIAAEFTQETGREVHFRVYLELDGTLVFGDVFRGFTETTSHLGHQEPSLTNPNKSDIKAEIRAGQEVLIDLHFHPEATEITCFSTDDLTASLPGEIMIVGAIPSALQLNLLVAKFESSNSIYLIEDIEEDEWYDRLKDAEAHSDQQAISTMLDEVGVVSVFLPYQRENPGEPFTPAKRPITTLKNFGGTVIDFGRH